MGRYYFKPNRFFLCANVSVGFAFGFGFGTLLIKEP